MMALVVQMALGALMALMALVALVTLGRKRNNSMKKII